MLKKWFTFLVVLILMVPASGFACGCNSTQMSPVSPGSMSFDLSISGVSCDCCEVLEVNRERCNLEQTGKANVILSKIQALPLPLAAGSVQTNHHLIFGAYSKFDSPKIFSKSPLYLALRVFRL